MNVFDCEKFLPTHPARMFRLGDTVVVRLTDKVAQVRTAAGLSKTFYARVSDVQGSFAKGKVTMKLLGKPGHTITMAAQTARENVFVWISSLMHNPSHLGHYFEGVEYVKKYEGYARLGESLLIYTDAWLPYEPMKSHAEFAKQIMRKLRTAKAQVAGENALREIRQKLKEAKEKEAQEKRSRRASDVISLSTERVVMEQWEQSVCQDQPTPTKVRLTEIVTVRLLRDEQEVGAKGPFYIAVDPRQAPIAVEQITTDIIAKTGVGRFYTFVEGEEGYFILEVANAVRRDTTTLTQIK